MFKWFKVWFSKHSVFDTFEKGLTSNTRDGAKHQYFGVLPVFPLNNPMIFGFQLNWAHFGKQLSRKRSLLKGIQYRSKCSS